MCRKLGLSCLCVLVLASFGFVVVVEADSSMWTQKYDGAIVNSLIATSDGGYAMAGCTEPLGSTENNFLLIKTDSSGNVEWNQTYGGTGADWAWSLVETSDGGYAVAGQTNSSDSGSYDWWLVKTDSAGNMEWNQTYGGENNDYAYSLIKTSDGGYALAGDTNWSSTERSDFFLVKTDSQGNMEWNQTYEGVDGDDREVARSVVETSADGGYAIGGLVRYHGDLLCNFSLIKVDSSGDMEWNQTYKKKGLSTLLSLIVTSDGGYAMVGWINHDYTSKVRQSDWWLVKTDSDGNVEWNQTYGGSEDDVPYSLVATSDGGYIITGETESFGAGNTDCWLIKTDAYGNMEWNRTYGGKDDDRAHSLVATTDGGYVIAGYTEAGESSSIWLIKTDENGVGPDLQVSQGDTTVIVTTLVAAGLILGVIVLIVHRTTRNKKTVGE